MTDKKDSRKQNNNNNSNNSNNNNNSNNLSIYSRKEYNSYNYSDIHSHNQVFSKKDNSKNWERISNLSEEKVNKNFKANRNISSKLSTDINDSDTLTNRPLKRNNKETKRNDSQIEKKHPNNHKIESYNKTNNEHLRNEKQENNCQNLKNFFCNNVLNFFIIKDENKCLLWETLILINISLHSFLFINAILFTDNYIAIKNAFKKSKLEYIIIVEYDIFIYWYIIGLFINKIFHWLLENKLNDCNINCFKKNYHIIINIIIFVFHLFCLFFFLIFASINQNTQEIIIISTMIFLAFCLFLQILLGLFRYCLKSYCKCCSIILEDFSG